MNKQLVALAAWAALAVGVPAQAALVTSSAGITPADTITFDSFDGLITNGPLALTANVTFSGTSGSQLGANLAVLGDNGLWGVDKIFAATDVSGTLTFAMASGTVSGFGAFVNHFDGASNALTVSAWDSNGQLLEQYAVNVSTPSGFNDGQFVGISRASADIASITFSGTGVVLDDLVHTSPIPEPGTYALMVAGLAALGALHRRRRAA